jgi:hypothetical protein
LSRGALSKDSSNSMIHDLRTYSDIAYHEMDFSMFEIQLTTLNMYCLQQLKVNKPLLQ